MELDAQRNKERRLMAGVRTPEDQIEKNENSYGDRTKKTPGFIHITPGKKRSPIPNCVGLPFAPGIVHPGLFFSPFHSRTNRIEDSV